MRKLGNDLHEEHLKRKSKRRYTTVVYNYYATSERVNISAVSTIVRHSTKVCLVAQFIKFVVEKRKFSTSTFWSAKTHFFRLMGKVFVFGGRLGSRQVNYQPYLHEKGGNFFPTLNLPLLQYD